MTAVAVPPMRYCRYQTGSRAAPRCIHVPPLFQHAFVWVRNALIHNALQNGPFCVVKWAVLQHEMAHFAVRNGPFCSVKWAEMQCEMGRFTR